MLTSAPVVSENVSLWFNMQGKTKHAIFFYKNPGKGKDSVLRKKLVIFKEKKILTLIQGKISLICYPLAFNQGVRLIYDSLIQ